MVRATPVLILTRPEPQSRGFLAELEDRLGCSVPAIVSPILKIVELGESPDLDAFQTLIFTSGNGVKRVADDLKGRNVVTVGQQTARYAEMAGATATCLGDTVEDFLANAAFIKSPALHVRGVHSRGDLANRLSAQGTDVIEFVAYDQVEQPISDEARRALLAGTAIAPIFSPRSARLLSEYECHPSTRILAISAATAQEWAGQGLLEVAVRPDRQAMLDLVAGAF